MTPREPHWAGERDVLRDWRDDELERDRQAREDEQADPTFATHAYDTSGGTE